MCDGGGEDRVQQGGADRDAELLADGDGRRCLPRVLGGHAEGASVDHRGDHHAQADSGQDERAEHTPGVPGVRAQLGEPGRPARGGQHPEPDQRLAAVAVRGFDHTVLAEFRSKVAEAGLERVALDALLA
jgi:hypothetical protein